ncbi:hypothetical protein WJR50_06235 [Catalinimonas sp. 4WD22]|uniref:hypothetical protein n=1 Tax=Catalinimonas locisalis TaxID=3133978 RepID=UPI003100FE65
MHSNLNKIVFLLAIIIFTATSCYDEDIYDMVSKEIFTEEFVKITPDTMSVYADGNSKLTFTFTFSSEADSVLTSLRLIASRGTFLESQNDTLNTNFSTLEDSKTAIANLVSTSTGNSTVRVEVQNTFKEYRVNFDTAKANRVSLTSNAFYIQNDTITEINLTATVGSDNGVASQGTPVYFSCNQADVGFFKSEKAESNVQGNAQTTFVFTDLTYEGDIEFTAKAINEEIEGDNNCEQDGSPCYQNSVIIKILE